MAKAKRKKQPQPVERIETPTPEQQAKGNVQSLFIVHVETWTTTKAHRVSNIIDKWFDERWPGFEEPARAAIDWCQERWNARGVIGKQCATYGFTSGGGEAVRDIELRDELDREKERFPPAHWSVFENVLRWGLPAGTAGSDWANNDPQAIASARAIVGMIANMIAMRRGY